MFISVIILIGLNKFNVKKFFPYLIVGIFLWDFTHQSGVHATIAGVILAMTIPHDIKNNKKSLLLKLEHSLSPYVAFGIMPIFAFANAGVSLEGLTFASLLNPVPLGIVLGLFFGKQIGVFVLYISVKLKLQINLAIPLGQLLRCFDFNWYWIYNESFCWKLSFC